MRENFIGDDRSPEEQNKTEEPLVEMYLKIIEQYERDYGLDLTYSEKSILKSVIKEILADNPLYHRGANFRDVHQKFFLRAFGLDYYDYIEVELRLTKHTKSMSIEESRKFHRDFWLVFGRSCNQKRQEREMV